MNGNMADRQWNRSLIIGYSGDLPDKPPVIDEKTLIIAADGGLKWAEKWSLIPHVVIGDFDSINLKDEKLLLQNNTIVKRFPREKNKTDLELAVDYALDCGIKKLILAGVWGGRIDHSLGNIDILYKLGLKRIEACILTSHARLFLVNRKLELECPLNSIVSLIPLTETVTGVSTTGLYYPLKDALIKKGSTWTISNKTIEPLFSVTCKRGVLIAVCEFQNPR